MSRIEISRSSFTFIKFSFAYKPPNSAFVNWFTFIKQERRKQLHHSHLTEGNANHLEEGESERKYNLRRLVSGVTQMSERHSHLSSKK